MTTDDSDPTVPSDPSGDADPEPDADAGDADPPSDPGTEAEVGPDADVGAEMGSDTDVDADTDPDGDVDASDDAAGTGDSNADGAEDAAGGVDESGGTREIVVPMRLYKTVTVVATLLAMAGVVGGFVFLDLATGRGSADGLEEIDPAIALLGLGFIVAGAATYAFSTRFRAEGMGKSKPDEDEPPDNG